MSEELDVFLSALLITCNSNLPFTPGTCSLFSTPQPEYPLEKYVDIREPHWLQTPHLGSPSTPWGLAGHASLTPRPHFPLPPLSQTLALPLHSQNRFTTPPAQIPSADYTPGFPTLGFSLCSNVFPQENLSLETSSEIVSTTLPLLAGCIFLQITYILCLFVY